jgi:hypothetical protein
LVGGLLTPLNQIKEILTSFDNWQKGVPDQAIVKDRRIESFWGPSKARIPGIEAQMTPAYKGTREEPIKQEMPWLRQATGLALSPPKNQLEKELDRLQFDRREYLPVTGNPEADNLIAQKMGQLVEGPFLRLLGTHQYQDMTEAEKGYFLHEALPEFKEAAKEWAMSEKPQLFMDITAENMPAREKRFMKEKGVIQ